MKKADVEGVVQLVGVGNNAALRPGSTAGCVSFLAPQKGPKNVKKFSPQGRSLISLDSPLFDRINQCKRPEISPQTQGERKLGQQKVGSDNT